MIPPDLERERDALRRLPSPAERRQIRKRVGAKLKHLSEMTGASVASVSRWETGETLPRGEYLILYVDVLAELSLLQANNLLQAAIVAPSATAALDKVTKASAAIDRAFEIRGETP